MRQLRDSGRGVSDMVRRGRIHLDRTGKFDIANSQLQRLDGDVASLSFPAAGEPPQLRLGLELLNLHPVNAGGVLIAGLPRYIGSALREEG